MCLVQSMLLFFVMLCGALPVSLASDYTFTESEAQSQVLSGLAYQLKEGDRLFFSQENGDVRKVVLGGKLPEGTAGVVFEIRNSRPRSVIKIFKPGRTAYELMSWELAGARTLEGSTVPMASILSKMSGVFVERVYINGPTLAELKSSFNSLSRAQQKKAIVEMEYFFSEFRTSGFDIDDLHASNIMFDTETEKWLLIDFGYARQGYNPVSLDLIANTLGAIESTHPELKAEFEFLRKFRDERLKLQKLSEGGCVAKVLKAFFK